MAIDDLMTDEEHEFMRLSGQMASLARTIIGDGPQADHDWAEFTVRIHAVQHMIMRQCAARAFPDLYRQLGETITSQQSGMRISAPPGALPPATPSGA